ncbi:PREDICTED: CD63 antigen-like [Nicrophorus vespilloides]|uniref:Tetraspanin n=1 Tax=Nicrophorus vespilloides TaxID=110193 RepID=A0ABM1MZ46_NICVS|nr:PREDICTED: CD63 antigen-like [Nicrophorus vespilloides]
MSWSAITIKYLLFIFNLLFVVTGIILLSVGLTTKAYFSDYETFLDQQYFSAPNLLIAIGAIIFIIAFFGCCGAVKQNYCMIITFSTLLILIFVLEFAAGIAGYVLRSQTEQFLNTSMHTSLSKYNKSNNNEVAVIWDTMQKNLNCCGVQDYQDWIKAYDALPMSCCDIQNGLMSVAQCNNATETLHQNGCINNLDGYISGHALTIATIGLIFAFIQMMGILCSCYLSKQVKQNYEYM